VQYSIIQFFSNRGYGCGAIFIIQAMPSDGNCATGSFIYIAKDMW